MIYFSSETYYISLGCTKIKGIPKKGKHLPRFLGVYPRLCPQERVSTGADMGKHGQAKAETDGLRGKDFCRKFTIFAHRKNPEQTC